VAKSNVLKALKIFGLEEMLKLSQSGVNKQVSLKRASGEDLIVWNDADDSEQSLAQRKEIKDNVLPFKKPSSDLPSSFESLPDPNLAPTEASDSASTIQTTDFILWSRELTKDSGAAVLKKEATKEYAKSTQMYIVKTSTIDGKEKIRFASTDGVLVDKKQA
jgi:hypothetical protein